MSRADDLMIETMKEAGELGDAEVLVDAALVYVVADGEVGKLTYGAVYLGGTMPHHSALGLAAVWTEQLQRGDDD